MTKENAENHPLVSLRKVCKYYRDGNVTALDNVSLDIQPGEFVSVVGPSGSGKSTMLNMIGALDHPTDGEVFLRETPLHAHKDRTRYGPRRSALYFNRTICFQI